MVVLSKCPRGNISPPIPIRGRGKGQAAGASSPAAAFFLCQRGSQHALPAPRRGRRVCRRGVILRPRAPGGGNGELGRSRLADAPGVLPKTLRSSTGLHPPYNWGEAPRMVESNFGRLGRKKRGAGPEKGTGKELEIRKLLVRSPLQSLGEGVADLCAVYPGGAGPLYSYTTLGVARFFSVVS